MKIPFPSGEFDEAVASVCHGLASDEQILGLKETLGANPAARDEYLIRVELHARLASAPDLFAHSTPDAMVSFASDRKNDPLQGVLAFPNQEGVAKAKWASVVLLAAALVLLLSLAFAYWNKRPTGRNTATTAVAMLSRASNAQWDNSTQVPTVGSALAPGKLRLKSGLAQLTFYSGARVVVEGPAELDIISSKEAFCHFGRLMANVLLQARGFRVQTPQTDVVDRGTVFGVNVQPSGSEVVVFKGSVECRMKKEQKILKESEGAMVEKGGSVRPMAVDQAAFATLFDLDRQSQITQERRLEAWRVANSRLDTDPSLIVHFDFDDSNSSEWTLYNRAHPDGVKSDAIVVGCQWTDGRWPGKRALEFGNVNDRVRFSVPGEFQALTLVAWVNVKGLDRQFNSLCMCDGFDWGKVHWQIRNDGVLDLGVQGQRVHDVQIFASPPVIDLEQFGQWIQLAVVLDGARGQVTHYANGMAVSRHDLRNEPPYRIGEAELGNWNSGDFPNKPPFLIRHFSGAMDEFALFGRALSEAEIHRLYEEGSP